MTAQARLAAVQFQDARREVRDLQWALASPGLLTGAQVIEDAWCQTHVSKAMPQLARLAADPVPLLNYLVSACRSRRLGDYFEALLGYWLEKLIGVRAFERGIAVRTQGRTIGEFDFLFEDPVTAVLMHWEVAVKFYLFDPKSGLYHGPAAKDRLDLKVDRIFNQQLKLGERAQSPGLHSRTLVKGMLFYPLTQTDRPDPLFPWISPTHARGWWIHLSDARSGADARFKQDSRWAVLKKPAWLSAPLTTESLSTDELLQYCKDRFSHDPTAVLVSELEKCSIPGLFQERSRGFIAPAGFPFR